MEYTTILLVNFIKKLSVLDEECGTIMKAASHMVTERSEQAASEWEKVKADTWRKRSSCLSKEKEILSGYQKQVENIHSHDIGDKKATFARIQSCKRALALVLEAEESISDQDAYKAAGANGRREQGMPSIEDLIHGEVDFIWLAHEINNLQSSGRKREAESQCATFYALCRHSATLLEEEMVTLRAAIMNNRQDLRQKYSDIGTLAQRQEQDEWEAAMAMLDECSTAFSAQKEKSAAETKRALQTCDDSRETHLQKVLQAFFDEFPPQVMSEEYERVYALEPSYAQYTIAKQMPENVHIGSIKFPFSTLNLSEYTKSILDKYYPFLVREGMLCIPFCATFGSEFNYAFRFENECRSVAVKNACDLGMRLFMMLPPGKLNFTFIDPVTLGESFAMFTRLVDVDDRTSEVINGKIWSAPTDVENKLKIMTDHISNVTQRCLQGKYNNIYEYNQVAEQNAEAYQVVMLMDYPAGLSEQSLRLLEQIVTSGPKCGVFTVIYRNESQMQKVSDKLHPLIANIETNFQQFELTADGSAICTGVEIKGQKMVWDGLPLPDGSRMDTIISTIRRGIKDADKVVIGIEKVSEAESSDSTANGIRIPIGIRGAQEIQYLTLGVGGSHHALIAGVAGSGKSSLLHTIILRALTQYSPEELVIYLVDFKRGVEFKIYADHDLPAFRVVAIESEREFGYNILEALEREQKIRADLFKRSHVDKIEEYREQGKKLPRVLVIMDEFHELFSNSNDEFARKSAIIMERIVRQGRAFGVHLILASQSYSNIAGIDRAVFDQMAVRIVLKCSKADANLLLDNGSTEIDQISIDDPGRAVYNSEAGNKEYNSHFRVAYIAPEMHTKMLQEISEKTKALRKAPTRILLSNIEDNRYSIFNQFVSYSPDSCPVPGRLYIGEPLSVVNNMTMDLNRGEYSNMLMVGNDTEKARSMFSFAILSLCINYWVTHHKAPEKPFIYLLNSKPLEDDYFTDTPKLLATELLSSYIRYIPCGCDADVSSIVAELYNDVTNSAESIDDQDRYFFVFGYQRAEELKSEVKQTAEDDIYSTFNLMPTSASKPNLSPKAMFRAIVEQGAQKGVHCILWQDSFSALYQDDKDLMSFFALRIAFDMSPEEFSRFVSANDVSLMSENNAIYYNKAKDNQKFRPYQTPDDDWLKGICDKLE